MARYNVLAFLDGTSRTADLVNGGPVTLTGTTKIKSGSTPATNIPCLARVRALRDMDSMPIRETWSDANTGAFTISDLSAEYTYTLLATDPSGNYRAVSADRITGV